MNKQELQGKWKQLKGKIQNQWGKITDDEFDKIEGDRKQLSGLIQEHYGKSREEAEKEIDRWQSSISEINLFYK